MHNTNQIINMKFLASLPPDKTNLKQQTHLQVITVENTVICDVILTLNAPFFG